MKSLLDDPTRCRWCGEPTGAEASRTHDKQGNPRREWTCSKCGHPNVVYPGPAKPRGQKKHKDWA